MDANCFGAIFFILLRSNRFATDINNVEAPIETHAELSWPRRSVCVDGAFLSARELRSGDEVFHHVPMNVGEAEVAP